MIGINPWSWYIARIPSCVGAVLSVQAFEDEFQQVSGEIGPDNWTPVFCLAQLITAFLIQSFSSLPNIPSSPAWGFKAKIPINGSLFFHIVFNELLKVIALNYSVNTTIGLPFIRTSPDHGTGFDIAGKGLAQSQSMVEAIKAAFDLTKDSRLFNAH